MEVMTKEARSGLPLERLKADDLGPNRRDTSRKLMAWGPSLLVEGECREVKVTDEYITRTRCVATWSL